MRKGPTIRQVKSADVRECERMSLPSDDPFVSKHDERIWAMYAEGKVVSFIVMQHLMEGSWYLVRAGTLETYRGNGFYPRLLACAFGYGRKNGIKHCITDTARWNTASANGLIKAGFRLYDPEYRWGFNDGLYWSKKL